MELKDGTGKGYSAKIDKEHRLHVLSTQEPLQHYISHNDQKAFQVSANVAIDTTEQTLLLIKNTSDTKDLVITYMRSESVGAAAANVLAYYNIKVGGDYSSGGDVATPTNMYVGAAVAAEGDFYTGGTAIVMSGTPVEIDRSFEANSAIKYSKEGSLIVPKNSVLSISHKGSTVAGNAYCRVSFYYQDTSV